MRYAFLSAAMLTVAACATPTGPDAARSFDRFSASESVDFRSYDRVQVLMPVAGPDVTERIGARGLRRDERPLAQRDVDAQLEELREELVRALGREARIVENGGDGVLTVATTLTHLNANRPTQAELAAEPGLSLQSLSTGDAGVRIELSENGRSLAVIEDRDNVTSLADPQAQAAGIWTTADRFFGRVSNKLAALLR